MPSRWWSPGVVQGTAVLVPLVVVGLVLVAGCAVEPEQMPERADPQRFEGPSWSVGLLEDDALGEGWERRELPDPAAGVLDGLCGIPDVLEHFPPSEVVRFERDAVVTHALVDTDDAPELAALLVSEIELCEQEDDRVTDATRVELDVDAPPTDAFRFHADVELLGVTSDAVWAITAVHPTQVSVVGASVSELFEDPGDPLGLVRRSVEEVYDEPGGDAGG